MSTGQQKTLPVTTQRSGGVAPTLTIRGEELAACNDFLHVTFSGKKLANKDGMFGKSDPYISLKKCTHRACCIGAEEDWSTCP